MRVLYVDNSTDGHHLTYLYSISKISSDCCFFLPNEIKISANCKLYTYDELVYTNYFYYLKWLKEIKSIAEKERVQIIHFLTGDSLLKYFSSGLNRLRPFKIIVTFHHFRYSVLRSLSRELLFKKIDYGVVHTEQLLKESLKRNIKNVKQIDYPRFISLNTYEPNYCKNYFGIPSNEVPLLSAIGSTRNDKGLDILLEALKYVRVPFYLLIAGKATDISEEVIYQKISSYSQNVFLKLEFLSEEEFEYALNATDILVLPYRTSFDGASGPLAEITSLGKMIIGPSHGSLGEIIKKYHLGLTFKTEDSIDLARTIEGALPIKFVQDACAKQYIKKLSVSVFEKKYLELYNGVISGELK